MIDDIRQRTERRVGYRFIIVFLFLAAVIITAGYCSYQAFQKSYRAEVARNLSVIAKLKLDELVDWRKERLGAASVFFRNASFSNLVRRYFANPGDAEARRELRTWLDKITTNYQYDQVRLLDTQGVTRMALPAGRPPVLPATVQRLSEVLRSGQVTFRDFYRNPHDRRIYLAVLVPILDEKNNGRPLAVLSLRIDPEIYLYPFIQQWPTNSRTAETLLVRREGNDALFLNELRFQKNTALNLRFPLKKQEMPAVKAALGQEGVVKGTDYRGAPVLAVVHTVPDSPWFLVTRMDIAEVYAPVRERSRMIFGFVVILLLCAAGILGFLWRQQNLRFYQDRYEATEALKDSEIRYRRLFESAKDGILILDAETGMVIDVNPFLIKLLDLPREQFIEKKLWELGFFKDSFASRANFLELQQKKYIRYEDLPLETADGRRIDVEFVSNVYEAGHRTVIQCNIRDITERRQAETALRESKALTDAVVENVPLMIFLKEAKDLRFVIFNRAGEELLGYDREALLGKNNLDLFPPEQAAHFMAKDREVLDGETGLLDIPEEPILTARKGQRLLHTRKVCIRGADGTTKFLLGVSEDITDRRQAELDLQRNSEIEEVLNKMLLRSLDALPLDRFLEDVLDLLISIPWLSVESRGAIFVVEDNPEVLVLKAARNLAPALLSKCARVPFGRCLCGRAAASGQIEYAGHLDEHHEIGYSGIASHGHYCVPIISGKRIIGVLNLYLKDGHVRDVKEEGFLRACAAVLAGIIERKHAEDDKKALLEQLVRAEKLAAVGELISGVAHEINNPLTGIIGLSELLLMENKANLDEDTKRDLESIHNSSERIKKIVTNLLRFARREAPMRKDVSVHELLDTVFTIRSYEMKSRNVEVIKRYQPDLPLVLADPSQLEQVFLNLIINAEYVMQETGKPGTLTITTSLQEEPAANKKVVIEISDTGAGIPEDVFPKLFNPFFTTKPIGKGTGLGLSVSYGIIKEHGGEISARNQAEGGAVFTIELPVRGKT